MQAAAGRRCANIHLHNRGASSPLWAEGHHRKFRIQGFFVSFLPSRSISCRPLAAGICTLSQTKLASVGFRAADDYREVREEVVRCALAAQDRRGSQDQPFQI
jgi:hypothetical protein